MKAVPYSINNGLGSLIIILASLGCHYFLSAFANKMLQDGCSRSDHRILHLPSADRAQHLFSLLNAHPKLIYTDQVFIQPNTQPMCVVVVASTRQLAGVPEFPRNNFSKFHDFKNMLLANNFTVYEFFPLRFLPRNRAVVFTHEHIRNQKSCTTAAVTTILADCSTFKYGSRRRHQNGLQHYVWHNNVSFVDKQRKESLIDADLLDPAKIRSGIVCVQVLLNLLGASPDLVSMNRVQIEPNSDFFCVVVIKSTIQLIPERKCPFSNFGDFKHYLLEAGFTVYEYHRSQASRLSSNREVILTHDSFRDEAQCTIESVSRVSIDPSRGHTRFIHARDVSFLHRLQNGVMRPAILQASPSSVPEAASGYQQANVALQQSISEAKHKRQCVQDVREDVGGVRHKKPRSSSSNAAPEHHSSVFDAMSFYHEELGVAFDQSQMMELSSSIETDTAFHYTPDASGSRSLPPSVWNYRPMEYGKMSLNERDRSLGNSDPQQLISGFDLSQIELPSWNQIVSCFDNTPNVSSSVSDCSLKERDEISLNEQLQAFQSSPST